MGVPSRQVADPERRRERKLIVDAEQGSESCRTPRTRDGLAVVRRERPDGWEYLLYAGVLFLGMRDLEGSYRDHRLRYAALTGDPLSEWDSIERLKAAFPDAMALSGSIDRFFAAESVERAFGRAGEPGDDEAIQHLAERTIAIYGSCMDWGRDLRSARVPTEFQPAFHLAADFMRLPVEQMREYIQKLVALADSLEELMRTGEPVQVTIILELSIDEVVSDKFAMEMGRLELDDYEG